MDEKEFYLALIPLLIMAVVTIIAIISQFIWSKKHLEKFGLKMIVIILVHLLLPILNNVVYIDLAYRLFLNTDSSFWFWFTFIYLGFVHMPFFLLMCVIAVIGVLLAHFIGYHFNPHRQRNVHNFPW